MKVEKWIRCVPIISLAIFLLLASCGNKDKKNILESTSSTASLRINLSENVKNFNPADFDNESEEFIGGLLYQGLFSKDSKGRIVNELVESYQLDSLTNTYNFQLKHGLKFSNGDKLSAFDVLISFKGIFKAGKSDIKNEISGVNRYIKENQASPDSILLPSGISFLKDDSFAIRLVDRDSMFINKLADSRLLIYKELSNSNLVGSGPFKVIYANDDISLNLTRNEYYSYRYKKESIDRVNIRFIKNGKTILDEFRNGALDVFPLKVENTQYEMLLSTLDEKYGSKSALEQSGITLTLMKFYNFKNVKAIEETINLLIAQQPKLLSHHKSIMEIHRIDSMESNLTRMIPKLQLINNSKFPTNSLLSHANDEIKSTNYADIDRKREFIVVEEEQVNIFGPYSEKEAMMALNEKISVDSKTIGIVILNHRRDFIIFDERLTGFKKYGNWVNDIQELKMKSPQTF